MIASLGPMLIASTLTSPIMAASAADANPVLADALHLPGDTEAIEQTAHAASGLSVVSIYCSGRVISRCQ